MSDSSYPSRRLPAYAGPMRQILITALVAILLPLNLCKAQSGDHRMLSPEETTAIRSTVTGLNAAWNTNDMNAYASFLTEDCDWINIVGMYWHGKAAVIKAHTVYLSTMFKGVQQQVLDPEISPIAPGVALVVFTLKMGDFTDPTGKVEKDMHDRMSFVMVKQTDGRWLIRAAHNTTINPIAAQFDPAKTK